MKKYLKNSILIFCFCFGFSIRAQIVLKIENDSLNSYYYSGGDEFNATSVNENYWSLLPYPKVNMAQFFSYDRHNTTIENGVVAFSMKEKDSTYIIPPVEMDSNYIKRQKINIVDGRFKMKYTAGIIISKEKLHYGLYELRFKVEKGKGLWPSFWFCNGYKNEEIDAFELKGEKNNKIHVDTHCPYGCDNGYKNKIGIKTNWGDWMPVAHYLHEGFNIFLLEWRQNSVTWYINGYPLAYFKGSFPNPMNLYLNTQVSSPFSAFQPGPDETTVFPNNFYVDYLRIWKKNPAGAKLILKPSDDFKISDRFPSDYNNKSLRHNGLVYIRRKLKQEKGMLTFNLSKDGKLLITVLGSLNNKKTGLVLKGAKEVHTLKAIGKENEVILSPDEKELELILTSGKKQFRQKIIIQR